MKRRNIGFREANLEAWIQVTHDSRKTMTASDMPICCSGTVTLEATLMGLPMVILYQVSRSSWLTVRIHEKTTLHRQEMKKISEKRHRIALKKEIKFWRKTNVLERQAFRTERYVPYLKKSVELYGKENISQVLDVGCGPSCCAQVIIEGTKTYLDPLLDEYRKIFVGQIPSGKYISKDIESSILENNFFDLILCLNTLDHVQNPWSALDIIRKALKPDGIFLLSIYTRNTVFAFLRNSQEYLNLLFDSAHPYSYTKSKMEKDLINAEFNIHSCELVAKAKDRSEYIWVCIK